MLRMEREKSRTDAPAAADWRTWFEEQFAAHTALVRTVIWNRLGRGSNSHLVEELAAETWARAVRGTRQTGFDRARAFASWVCGVAINVCHEHARHAGRHRCEPLPEGDALIDPQEGRRAQELLELHQALADCIARLSAADRNVYDLRFARGLSGRATAEALGVPEATFREKLLPTVFRKLVRCLEGKGFTEWRADFPAQPAAGDSVNRNKDTKAMTPDEAIERLLIEHAALREVGLLQNAPTPVERARVDAELAENRPTSVSPIPINATPARVRRWRRLGWAAAAAVLIVGGGLSAWLIGHRNPPVPPVHGVGEPVSILNGRGRVVPVSQETRFSVVDAATGQLRLDHGEIYVELQPRAGLRAEVETPAGKATALGTRFCAHYHQAVEPRTKPLLAVVILSGAVEVTSPQGRAVGDAGEVVLVEPGTAPEHHSESHVAAHSSVCPFASTLGLVYRPEVQTELRLTDAQLATLQRPTSEELQAVGAFFRGLQSLPPAERGRQASAFCTVQHKKLADLLTARQQQRLRQLGWQQEGSFALVRPEVAVELGLTAEQREQGRTRLKEYADAHRRLLANPSPPAELARQISALRLNAAEKLGQMLTDEQKQHWDQMQGERFALPPLP